MTNLSTSDDSPWINDTVFFLYPWRDSVSSPSFDLPTCLNISPPLCSLLLLPLVSPLTSISPNHDPSLPFSSFFPVCLDLSCVTLLERLSP
ncbi:hypothetical protein E2C01_101286 [Portunus trituberculatus]|uniref:Uncharacterized protein n=1 Tax=Portunus trituberculatus TaxID=210409 RepID=A0A5B7KJQ9_PORTR|nr:hypothetical protein [Portunus trituberculatus]